MDKLSDNPLPAYRIAKGIDPLTGRERWGVECRQTGILHFAPHSGRRCALLLCRQMNDANYKRTKGLRK